MPSSSRSNTPGAQNEQLPEPMHASRSILMSSAMPDARRSTRHAHRRVRRTVSPRPRRSARSGRRPRLTHVGSGSTTCDGARPAGRVGHRRLEPGRDAGRGTRRRARRPREPRTTCTGSAGAVGERLHPRRRRACRRRSRRCGAPGSGDASIIRRVTNPAASNAARRTDAGAVREVEVDELRRAGSGPGTAPARRAGTAPRPARGRDRRPTRRAVAVAASSAVDPVEEEPARVARAADEELAAPRCAGSCSSSGPSTGSGITAQTISVVPQITSTSPTSSAPATSCSPIASIVPPSSTQPGRPVTSPSGWPDGADASASGRARAPHSASFVLVPLLPVEQRARGRRDGRRDRPASPDSAWFATACAIQ